VAKSYNKDGTTKESYEDVVEILEDLFNFAKPGELPGKNLKYIDNEGIEQSIEVKLRVPIPLNARDEAGNVEFNYTYSPENTSRDSSVSNSRFFETNFEALAPTRVFIEFNKEQPQEELNEETGVVETKVEEKKEVVTPISLLTKEEINTLNFNEIRERITSAQMDQIEAYAIKEGFKGADHFFEVLFSSHPEEQALFRDYLIECLL